jgi:hypothetical protein
MVIINDEKLAEEIRLEEARERDLETKDARANMLLDDGEAVVED